MNYILFDDKSRLSLKPLTYTRPIAELRVGILTIKEKWCKMLDCTASYITEEYLQKKYPCTLENDNTLLNGGVIPTKDIIEKISGLETGNILVKDEVVIAAKLSKEDADNFCPEEIEKYSVIEYSGDFIKIKDTHNIFTYNKECLIQDFEMLTEGRESQPLSKTVNVYGDYPVFLEKGAKAEFCTLNTTEGPVYLAEDAEIMEGCLVRGPLAIGEHSSLKMGAKVYGATTLGPHCKCGGELSNVVFTGYSNKAHDGFLGNAVIGEWCNIGADTNNSNLKNTYDEVKLWDYETRRFKKTGLQFCGLIMGDHSKFGINTMLNTGTVVGVGCNIFGSDFPRNFLPSFSWGGHAGMKEHVLRQFFKTAEAVMKRRNIELDETEKEMLTEIFEQSKEFRNF